MKEIIVKIDSVNLEIINDFCEGEGGEQPVELIRCKDCKHHYYDGDGIFYCEKNDYGYGWKDDDFCSKAEKKERMTLYEAVKKINDAIYDAFGWPMEVEKRKE